MTRLQRRRAEQARRRNRALLLVALFGFTFAAVMSFATGLIVAGVAATLAGVAAVAAAGRHARPVNGSPQRPDTEGR